MNTHSQGAEVDGEEREVGVQGVLTPQHCFQQSCPAVWPGFPSSQGCCLRDSSCPPVPRLGLWDLHGYEAGHGGLETVKDVASGEGHEVVHEGRQGEDEGEPLILGFAV